MSYLVENYAHYVNSTASLTSNANANYFVSYRTAKAMGEGISFRESFAARLDIFKPSKQKVTYFSEEI